MTGTDTQPGSTSPRRSQYVLLSDVHLIELGVSDRPGWWTYRDPSASQDPELIALLRAIERQRPESYESSVVIFNGDTWDIDSVLSRPGEPEVVGTGLPSTATWSVFKMRRLVRDHEAFVAELAAFLGAGNRAIFVMGNHDRELAFPEVAEVLRQRVAELAPPGQAARAVSGLEFEPWFVHVPGVLFAEHGQQYDATCSYRDVLHPFSPPDRSRPAEVEASLGSVLGRRVVPVLGTFNPFDDDSFIQSLGGYARHAVKHYWPRRPFLTAYLGLAVAVLIEMLGRRRRVEASPADSSEAYAEYARAHGHDQGFLDTLRQLWSRPVHDQLGGLLHELWIDRMLVVAFAAVVLVLGIYHAESWRQAMLLVVLLPPFALVMRALGRGSVALQERGRWGLVAEQVSARLGVPIVAFGHSHRPERRPLRSGGRYYNLGTWAPVRTDLADEDPEPLLRARRYLVVRPGRGARLWVAFQQWEHSTGSRR